MASRKKNFSTIERNLLLQILKTHKHIIENKKTDSTTVSMKKAAWARIAEQFNNSSVIAELATADQLRRLWQNLKTRQRDNITKERQHRMATGGGGPCPDAEINIDIAEISPALIVEIPDAIDSDYNFTESIEPEVISTSSTTNPPPDTIVPETQIEDTPTYEHLTTQTPIVIPTIPTQIEEVTLSTNPNTDHSRIEFSNNEKQLRVQILKQEYINRERRANQIHNIHIRQLKEKHQIEMEILTEQLKEAKAKAESAQQLS